MAGAAGFEPTDAGTKTRCLTTWRRPNHRLKSINKNMSYFQLPIQALLSKTI